MSFVAVGAVGVLVTVASSGLIRVLGTILFLLGMVIGGGSWTMVQLRAYRRRAASDRDGAKRPHR